MSKPKLLFHGSCRAIEGALIPRPQHGDMNGPFPEGDRSLVFATDDPSLAAVYALKNAYMLSTGTERGCNFAVLRDYDSWQHSIKSAPCSVYGMPSESFTNVVNKNDGQPSPEWLSSVSVTPSQIWRQTPNSAMQTGAQLFFLDKHVTNELWHYNPEQSPGDSFLNRLAAKQKAGALPADLSPMVVYSALIKAGIMRHLNAEQNIEPVAMPSSPYSAVIAEDIDWLRQHISAGIANRSWTTSLGPRTGYVRDAAG